jgi:prepilin-type N-terminal cleavage/methylation domain-containing protein
MNARCRFARRAFTLLEVLLAIAVAGILIAASSYMIVSLSTIWTLRTDDDSFEEHADGVAAFLQKAFDEASSRYQPTWKNQSTTSKSESDSSSSSSDSSSSTETTAAEKLSDTESSGSAGLWKNAGVTMARIDDTSMTEVPSIHFYFFQFPPALGETTPPTSIGVEAWLKFDERKGLAMVWKDIWSIQDGVVSSDKDLLRTSVISTFVTKITYIYRDEDVKRWEQYDAPHEDSDTYAVPTFIRLTFTMNGQEIVRTIHVRASANKMPLF